MELQARREALWRHRNFRRTASAIVLGVMFAIVAGGYVFKTWLNPEARRDQVLFVNNGGGFGTLELNGRPGFQLNPYDSLVETVGPGTHTAVMVGFDKKRSAAIRFTVPPKGDRAPYRAVVQFGAPQPMRLSRQGEVVAVAAEPFATLPAGTVLAPVK